MLSSTVELGSLLKKLEGGGSSAALATLSPAPARIPRISKANSGEVQRSEVEVKNQAEPAAFKVEPSVSSVKIPPAATSTPISVPISEVEVPSQQVSPEPETRVPDKDIVAAQVPSVSASTRLPESDDEKKKIITLVKDRWEDFIGVVHKKSVPLSFFLKECKPVAIENSILYLEFDPMHKFHSEQVNQTDNKEIIETEFLKLFGYQIRFKCTFKESSTQKIERVKLDSGQSQVFFSKEDSLAEINKNPVLKHLKEKLDAEVI
jgi:hypothetical protein